MGARRSGREPGHTSLACLDAVRSERSSGGPARLTYRFFPSGLLFACRSCLVGLIRFSSCCRGCLLGLRRSGIASEFGGAAGAWPVVHSPLCVEFGERVESTDVVLVVVLFRTLSHQGLCGRGWRPHSMHLMPTDTFLLNTGYIEMAPNCQQELRSLERRECRQTGHLPPFSSHFRVRSL